MSDGSPTSASRWSRRNLAVAFFPFVAAAVAITLFLASLIDTSFDLPVLTPRLALAFALPLGLSTTRAAARWVGVLLYQAEVRW